MNTYAIHQGDVRERLREMPAGSAQTCVTSPPYFALRDYGMPGQIGLEPTPDLYVATMVDVFREVKRVLRDDGTLWLNLGDSYASNAATAQNPARLAGGFESHRGSDTQTLNTDKQGRIAYRGNGVKGKDLIGIPWMVAFALRADGWYLRSDIIWSKPNPMPESVTDRPTKAHEYIFLLSKSSRYYYDAAAIREQYAPSTVTQFKQPYEGQGTKDYAAAGVQNPSDIKRRITDKQRGHGRRHAGFNDRWDASVAEYSGKHSGADEQSAGRRMLLNAKAARDAGAPHDNPFGGANKRSVWHVATQPYPEAHFATYPEKLIEPCILAGSRPAGKRCDCDEIIATPTGSGPIDDPTLEVGRAGFSRPRRAGEGSRPITRREQRSHAEQMRVSPFRDEMAAAAGPAFAHYIRTDASGARPLPPALLTAWLAKGWLVDAEPCRCPVMPADTVLDPFTGSGTTGAVAIRHQRNFVGCELNPEYVKLAEKRIGAVAPLFSQRIA